MTIFGKNASAFAVLMKTKTLYETSVPTASGRRGERSKKPDTSKLTAFLTKFIRLHGLLFDWSTQMHRDHSQIDHSSAGVSWAAFSHLKISSLPQPEGFGSEEIDVEMFISLLQNVLEDFDHQIAQSILSDEILVKLLVICIFSVHYSARSSSNILLTVRSTESSPGAGQPHKSESRSTPESLALITLFGVINRYETIVAWKYSW